MPDSATGEEAEVSRQPFTSPLAAVGQHGVTLLENRCDWEAGTLAYGWVHVSHTTAIWVSESNADGYDGCPPRHPTITHVNDGLLGYPQALAVHARAAAARLMFAGQVPDSVDTGAGASRRNEDTCAEGDTVLDDRC